MALAATRETAKEKQILTAIKAISRLVKYPNARRLIPGEPKGRLISPPDLPVSSWSQAA